MGAINEKKMLGKDQNVVGVIGKNGKSMISHFIKHCFGTLDYENKITKAENFSKKMHQDIYELDAKNVIIETSVCEIEENYASYIDFDHLIYINSAKYANTNDIWTMKRPFIALPINKKAIINLDDEHGADFTDITIADVISFGIREEADLRAANIKLTFDDTTFDLYYKGDFICETTIPFFGNYSVYNTLATVAYFVSLGHQPGKIAGILTGIPKLNGKFEQVQTGNDIRVFVDYARNPDAIESVLKSLNTLCMGDIISVVGADGFTNRHDRSKMGKITLALSKNVVFTNDNPRTEEPQGILYDMIRDSVRQNYRICTDREKAIEIALKMAKPNDVVLLFGKGHEKVQIVGEKIKNFCDVKTANYLIHKYEI